MRRERTTSRPIPRIWGAKAPSPSVWTIPSLQQLKFIGTSAAGRPFARSSPMRFLWIAAYLTPRRRQGRYGLPATFAICCHGCCHEGAGAGRRCSIGNRRIARRRRPHRSPSFTACRDVFRRTSFQKHQLFQLFNSASPALPGRCARHIRCSRRHIDGGLPASAPARGWRAPPENAGHARRTAWCPRIRTAR